MKSIFASASVYVICLLVFQSTSLSQPYPGTWPESLTPDGPFVATISFNPAFSADIRVFPTLEFQYEQSIAQSPVIMQNLLIGAITPHGTGFFHSTNGGSSWAGDDSLPGTLFPFDPVVAFTNDGSSYYHYIQSEAGTYKARVKKSLDGGATWGQHVDMPNAGQADKGHMISDVNKIYVAWTDFVTNDACNIHLGPYPIKFARSVDGGASFTTFGIISGASIPTNPKAQGLGVNMAMGLNGYLYATWAVNDSFVCMPVSNPSWAEEAIGFNKSTDGGITWQTASRIHSIQGIRADWTHKNPIGARVRVYSNPAMAVDRSAGPNNGNIYVVWPDKRFGSPDILLSKSANGGAFWTKPIRVNNDPSTNGKDQWMPWISVNPDGVINVIFYDSRNDANNRQTEVWMAQSTDGGSTFKNYKISDVAFTPFPIVAGYRMGEYITLTTNRDYAYACWMDNRIQNAGFNYFQTFFDKFGTLKLISVVTTGWNMTSIPNRVHSYSKVDVYTGVNPSQIFVG